MTYIPLPLFDSLEHIATTVIRFENYPGILPEDFMQSRAFLQAYRGSQGTFNAYRRELERLLQWCSGIARKSLQTLDQADIERYIQFCQAPPSTWISKVKAPRFIETEGVRLPNPQWRPFVTTVSKVARRLGAQPKIDRFELSPTTIKEILAILSTFFNYLLTTTYVAVNPVALIRQKSKFIRHHQSARQVRKLSELQWQTIMQAANNMAAREPARHEKTLFIMSALYSLYLRISELGASARWAPVMYHFYRDDDDNWWFNTVGKGNKERQIAVSDAMLAALKRWRKFLGLPTLPSPGDHTPLLPKQKGKGAISSINYIRRIVQACFDEAITQLQHDGLPEEAESLMEATVHWLRHTGISEDVKHRPREHVRDDAGHSSSAITDRYIDVERRERHASAKKKKMSEEPVNI